MDKNNAPKPQRSSEEFEEVLQENMALAYALGLEGKGITSNQFAMYEKYISLAHQASITEAYERGYKDGEKA